MFFLFHPGIRIAKKLGSLTHKLLICHIYDNYIKFEVSLRFWGIWPTARHAPFQFFLWLEHYPVPKGNKVVVSQSRSVVAIYWGWLNFWRNGFYFSRFSLFSNQRVPALLVFWDLRKKNSGCWDQWGCRGRWCQWGWRCLGNYYCELQSLPGSWIQ